jgi:hypothetical protein
MKADRSGQVVFIILALMALVLIGAGVLKLILLMFT